MKKAPIGIESFAHQSDRDIFGEHGIAKGKEGIDGVFGRASVAGFWDERGACGVLTDEGVPIAEIDGGDASFNAHEFVDGLCIFDALDEKFHFFERCVDILGGVSSQEGALIEGLGFDEGFGVGEFL